MPKVDLHTHSYYSDGVSSPAQVVKDTLKTGVQVYALSDHDTTQGLEEARAACEASSIDFIPAVEVSTQEHDHLHFLGYNIDLQNKPFQQFLAQNRQNRITRIKKIIQQIADSGVDLTEEDVFSLASTTISRAHVADALKKKRVVPTRQEGFRKFLVPGQVGYVPSLGVSVIEAIHHIKRAGGFAVIAHPGLVSQYWNFPAWVEAGLQGIEVFYPAHTYTMKQELLKIARKYDLLATGGSDYHGAGSGRTGTPGMAVPPPYYDRILRKLLGK